MAQPAVPPTILALPGLRAETRTLIRAQTGPIPPPVRAELFGVERLRRHGVSLAQSQPVERRRGWRRWPRAPAFSPRVTSNLHGIARARAYLAASDADSEALRPAAEWLLDNGHLIEAQASAIRDGMPHGYYAALPKLRSPPLTGLPRVYGIVWAYVAHSDSNFDAALLTQLLDAYQTVDTLTLGELWAVPTTLRVVLLENLARLAESAACHQAAQELADLCCDDAAAPPLATPDAVHDWLKDRRLDTVFLAQMIARARGRHGAPATTWTAWLKQRAPDPDAVLVATQALLAADNVSVRNAVSALHAINNLTWRTLVDQVSAVNQVLRESPAFMADSEMTQDQCVHEIERLARRFKRTELEVARQVQALARARTPTPTLAETDDGGPAYWLIGAGRLRLVQALGGPQARLERPLLRWLRRTRGLLYAAALLGGTALVLSVAVSGLGWLRPTVLATLVLAALAAFECTASLVNRMLAELVRVQRLPRVALDEGLGPQHRTLVVVPCLLTSPHEVASLGRQLEQHCLANPEAHTRFALLSDWPDAARRRTDADAGVLDAARQVIDTLNERYPTAVDAAPRFGLLHRERTWNDSENAWLGWERKRGKLEQLITALADGAAPHEGPFVDLGPISHLSRDVRYVVTLDSDTVMPPGTLRQLVAIAAHPLNRPQVDPDTHRVVAGYGILQPGLAAPLPRDGEVTAFGWLFAGPWGFDVYSAGTSEVFQDVFGHGRFSGKGLLDVQAIDRSLRGRIPENSLLSHDLYEGLWARAAHVSDVLLVESAPMLPDVAQARLHRWTRGDWQLLPLLRVALRGRVGALNLWKMVDNLRRSLLAPASLLLLWLSLATDTLAPWVALALTAAAFGLGPLVGALAALLPPRRDLALRHFLREGGADLARALGGTAWHLATLPLAAARDADAIVRTLWRLFVSRRHLLEWTTAAQAQARAQQASRSVWRHHAGVSLLALVWTASAAAMPDAHRPWLLALGATWMLTPLWLWLGSRPLPARRRLPPLATEDRAELRRLAQDTWAFFERVVTEADHHLPPDNLQLEPEPMLAHRTSPTNIGLYLASCVCAQRFGFIDTAALVTRLEATLAAVQALPRWHGHLDNWIDTRSLQPLTPRYVSSVDSGNLAACLWAVAQACRDTAAQAPWQARLRALARRCDALVQDMDFKPLYDQRRRLFRIGYRHDDACLDPAFYDLLASESRITSFVAIAKGDVPLKHWSALGRPFLGVDGEPALRSWTGSMFEYLMPSLLMAEPPRSLLQRTGVAAVRAQQAFGRSQGVPWGVSECAYYEQDHTLAFQYGPFGVPQLALRRTPLRDLVVAPYASVLALAVDPHAALANLRALARLDARDPLGFIEALDFSAARGGSTDEAKRVATVMAHHQGMSLLALCNLLCGDGPRHWFGQAPRPRAFQTLQHERMPRAVVFQASAIPLPARAAGDAGRVPEARVVDPAAAAPSAMPSALIGNGSYTVSLRPHGAGQSQWRGHAVTRSRDDLLRDDRGHWLLLRRVGAPDYHSVTACPLPAPATTYLTRFHADHVSFEAESAELASNLRVWVSSDDDVELRRLALHNLTGEAVAFELMSLFETVLAPQAGDESHPVFSNLFIDAKAVGDGCLIFERRPHRVGERGLWVAHFLAASDADVDAVQMVCDRAQVLPRRGVPAQLRAAADGTLPTGLDPVAALTVRLRVPAHARRCITVATAAAADVQTLMALVDEYRQEVHLTRSMLMATTLARIRHREWRVAAPVLYMAQDLATRLLMSASAARPLPALPLDRRALWRLAISGDRPIVLVEIRAAQGLRAVRALLTAQRLWQFGGLPVDLVLVNREPPSYGMPLQRQLQELFAVFAVDSDPAPERGRTQCVNGQDISAVEWAALQACARAAGVADGRPIEQLWAAGAPAPAGADACPMVPEAASPSSRRWPQPSAAGGFADGGQAFDIHIDQEQVTPRPWANVIANPGFGCVVTESGGGHTWAVNSRMNQLTPWRNDPLVDPPGEHFWVHDETTGQRFGLLPTVDRNGAAGYTVSHRAGISDFAQQRQGLSLHTRVMVHPDAPVKCLQVQLHHTGTGPRRLQLLGLVEWVLGAQPRDRMTLDTGYAAAVQAVTARQMDRRGGNGDGTAFLMLAGLPVTGWTCDRQAFFTARGQLCWPAALDGTAGFALDPCGALATAATLAPGQRQSFTWVIGHAAGPDEALALAQRLRSGDALAGIADAVRAQWDSVLSAVTVSTPDPLFDALVNRWLLYQTLACRLWARAGYYQVSGATGFRDQLQDALALAIARPGLLRRQLLVHAAHQFPEGDVQHWWHDSTGAGVRTHSSDDLLWLPYATSHYLAASGDGAVLDEPVAFLDGAPVPPGAEDLYDTPGRSDRTATLYEHAARAIDHSLPTGAHGLPLMRGGDWNDGMNRVGHEGRGESVWLGWFLLVILRDWEPLAQQRGDEARAERWAAARQALSRAMAAEAWDGAWYRRAYFDNGHPLGSRDNDECRIDLIAQAWSVFASPPGDERARTAMDSVETLLVDRQHDLVRLLHPPLQHSADHAGYIQAYPPGVRENGGQYTHAGVWALMAQAQLGHAEEAWALFRRLSPAHRTSTPQDRQRYGIEPYVLPGDTYTAVPYAGRGGWSWYTGSAAWLYRAAVESLLGLCLRHDRLCLRPLLPPHWPHADLVLQLPGRTVHVHIVQGREAPPPAADAAVRTLAVGEWVMLDSLPPQARLQVAMLEPPPADPMDRAMPAQRTARR